MNKPLLTALSFSGGKQSSALLWMVLLGKIEVDPASFVVMNADPGMENSRTYPYVKMMFDKCRGRGIEIFTADGPNLYRDLVDLKTAKKTRIDNPPYWVNNNGKLGRLTQGCTKYYKILPMNRAIRKVLYERFGISPKSKRLGNGIVEKWIGFSYSEVERIKPPEQKYITFRYPLIEMKMHNEDVLRFFSDNGLPVPPRSVCNACFANGLDTLREMYLNRPEDWAQRVGVDRHLLVHAFPKDRRRGETVKKILMAQLNWVNTELYAASMIAFAWFVWERGYAGRPMIGWV